MTIRRARELAYWLVPSVIIGCGGGGSGGRDAQVIPDAAVDTALVILDARRPDATAPMDLLLSGDATGAEDVGGVPDAPEHAGDDAPVVLPPDAPEENGAVDALEEGDVLVDRDAGPDIGRDLGVDSRRDAGGDAPLALAPIRSGTEYTFAFGDTRFVVDTGKGARITTFSLGGVNVLGVQQNASDNNWGSTFWPSPQSNWNWPPPAEIDGNAYSPTVASGILTATSKPSSALGLSVTKAFFVDAAASMVVVEYTLGNRGSIATQIAPWEISRVPATGLTFFPMGEGVPRKGSSAILPLVQKDGIAWAVHADKTATVDQKVFADGAEGWIAHVSGGTVFVKSFPDISVEETAPGEGEIELYADPANTYIEIENQGAYERWAGNASIRYRVRWFVRALPPSVSATVGDPSLIAFVRSLVQ